MRDFALYHGTSSFFAKRLLLGSQESPLVSSSAFGCASALYKLMLDTTGSFEGAAALYPEESGIGTVAALALKNVYDDRDASLMAYGSFYASLNKDVAGCYAANNPCGSELLRFITATITALRGHRVTGLDEILMQYPNLIALLGEFHLPVVLVLRGIALDRLASENGSPFGEEGLAAYQKLRGLGARVPGAVRIGGPLAAHVSLAYRVNIADGAPRPGLIWEGDLEFEEIPLEALIHEHDPQKFGVE